MSKENILVHLENGAVLGDLLAKTPMDLYYETLVQGVEDDFMDHFVLMGFSDNELNAMNSAIEEQNLGEKIEAIKEMSENCNCVDFANEWILKRLNQK